MKSASAPRRVYNRAGSMVLCHGGVYFGPKANATSEINSEKEVKIEVLTKVGGKARIQVTQRVGSKPAIVETWNEKHLTFEKRATA